MEVDDLAQNGIEYDPEDYADRGIRQLEDGKFSVHFKIKILNGGDLKYLVALWGLSGCSADTPCPWCFCHQADFGNWRADIKYRYIQFLINAIIMIVVLIFF